MKEENEKAGLKLNAQKTKIMASIPIISWQIDGEKAETVADFIFMGSKITVVGDCSQEVKGSMLLVIKAMANPHSIVKSRDITLPKKVCIVKAMVFPVVMYGYKSWTIKKLLFQDPIQDHVLHIVFMCFSLILIRNSSSVFLCFVFFFLCF